MNEGFINTYDVLKGFGFIRRTHGKDLFFHCSEIDPALKNSGITVGLYVSFDIAPTKKNRAVNVKLKNS